MDVGAEPAPWFSFRVGLISSTRRYAEDTGELASSLCYNWSTKMTGSPNYQLQTMRDAHEEDAGSAPPDCTKCADMLVLIVLRLLVKPNLCSCVWPKRHSNQLAAKTPESNCSVGL